MSNMKAGLMAATIAGLLGGAELGMPKHMRSGIRMARPAKRYPSMVTSSPREIAAHNETVNTRQVRRAIARKAKKTA